MFALHHELIEVADHLARCYCLIGSYSDAARYIKVCLPAVEERQDLQVAVQDEHLENLQTYFLSGLVVIALS
jgi:hypothetical protein